MLGGFTHGTLTSLFFARLDKSALGPREPVRAPSLGDFVKQDALCFTADFAALGALATVPVFISRAATDRPRTAGAVQLGAWVVTTVFMTLGGGVLVINGVILPAPAAGRATGLRVALDCAGTALGVGFWRPARSIETFLTNAGEVRQAAPAAD